VNPQLDRKTFLRGSLALAIPTFGMNTLLAACGGDSGDSAEAAPDGTPAGTATTGTAASGTTAAVAEQRTLRMPLTQDIQPPDPDTYFGQAMAIVQACYEGLLEYVPGSSDVRGQLAETWEVSDDGLVYTFHLKPGVKFHDGTDADASAWVASIERRRARNQGPAFMTKGLTPTAPDPLTLVLTLDVPNIAFPHYLACPWRFFVSSPTTLAANEVDGDLGVGWLATHDAGTGPYMFTEAVPGTSYALEAFPDWWGGTPQVGRIELSVIPDAATRRLQLESGDFDIVAGGLSFEDIEHFRSDPNFTVVANQAPGLMAFELNPFDGVMSDPELRAAVYGAIDRQAALDQVYKGEVIAAEGLFSDQVTKAGAFPLNYEYNPQALADWVAANGSVDVDFGYPQNPVSTRLAELIGAQLLALGLNVTTRALSSAQMYDLGSGPADLRPDLLLGQNWSTGDGLHVDTGLQIQLYSGSTLLNYFGFADPEMDALIDEARAQPTEEAADAVYQEIADEINAMKFILPLGHDVQAVVAVAGIDNIEINSYLKTLFYPERLTFVG
jgi:peptide/nickel transport system substrate-binding protein